MRIICRFLGRWRLDWLPSAPIGERQARAVGPGPDGDARGWARPSEGTAGHGPYPCRCTRRSRCFMGDGGRPEMLRDQRRHRRIVGQPTGAGFHRDTSPCGGSGTQPSALLAGPARRPCKFERSSDALANRQPAFAYESVRLPGSRRAGLGRRAVSSSGPCSWKVGDRP